MALEGGFLKTLKGFKGGGINLNLFGIQFPTIKPIWIVIIISVVIFFYIVFKYWDKTPWTRVDHYG